MILLSSVGIWLIITRRNWWRTGCCWSARRRCCWMRKWGRAAVIAGKSGPARWFPRPPHRRRARCCCCYSAGQRWPVPVPSRWKKKRKKTLKTRRRASVSAWRPPVWPPRCTNGRRKLTRCEWENETRQKSNRNCPTLNTSSSWRPVQAHGRHWWKFFVAVVTTGLLLLRDNRPEAEAIIWPLLRLNSRRDSLEKGKNERHVAWMLLQQCT